MENKFIINLTFKQLFYFGIHVGHLRKNSCFLAGWIFYGWRNNIFIINLFRTMILIKMGIKLVKSTIRISRPFWFASLSKIYGPLISRYATLAGEPFNIYQWIGGNLTNSKLILGWLSILLYLLKKKNIFWEIWIEIRLWF
jgi:ribosomal protein S2